MSDSTKGTKRPNIDTEDMSNKPTGGAYIPPMKLRMMQAQLQEKNTEAYQRFHWEQIKKRIHGQINRVNVSNIVDVARALLRENLLRGK